MFSKKLSNFFLTGIAIVGIFFFFGFVVLPRAVEWRLHHYFQEKFGSTLSYDDVKWKSGSFEFSNLKVKSRENTPIKFLFTVNQLSVKYYFSLLERNIGLDIEFDDPKISLTRETSRVFPWQYFQEKIKKEESDAPLFFSLEKSHKSRFFYTDIHCKVTNGTIDFINPDHTLLLSEKVSGEGHFGSNKNVAQMWQFSYGTSEERLPSLFFTWDESVAHFSLHELDCEKLSKSFEFLYGPSLNVWTLKQGKATGKLNLSLTDLPFLEGNVLLHDTIIEHPSSSIGAELQEMDIVCSQHIFDEPFETLSYVDKLLLGTNAKAVLSKGASFYRFKEGLPYWMLRNISGGVFLNSDGTPGFQMGFNGQFFFNKDQVAKVLLTGKLPLIPGKTREESIHFSLDISNTDSVDVGAKLYVLEADNKNKEIDLIIDNIGPREYETVRNLWPEWSFVWEELEFTKGSVSCEAKALLLPNETLSKITIENINAKELWFASKGLNIDGYVSSLSGSMDFVLSRNERYLRPKNGSLHLNGGDFHWEKRGLNQENQDSLERFTDVACSLTLKEGILQDAHFKGNLGGMQSEFQFYGLSAPTVARMQVDGRVEKILSFLPFPSLAELQKAASGDYLTWKGELKNHEDGLKLSGDFLLKDAVNAISVINLDVNLERIPANTFVASTNIWKRWGISLMERQEKTSSLPFQRPGSLHVLKVDWLQDRLGAWGVILKQGSIRSDHFAFKKYLTPFVFSKENSFIDGIASFQGDFNDQSLLMHFQIKDLVIEDTDFRVSIPQMGSLNSKEVSESDPSGFFYYSFSDDSSYFFSPLARGMYQEKKSGLIFTDLYAQMSFSKRHMQISDMRGRVENVDFETSIDLDFNSTEYLNVHLRTKHITGDVPSVQKFCSHFKDLPLWRLPVKGMLTSGASGVVFNAMVPYDQRKSEIFWSVSGRLQEGNFSLPSFASTIEKTDLEFSYASDSKVLSVVNGVGEIKAQTDHYVFFLPKCEIDFKQEYKAFFDLKVDSSSSNQEFLRLLGEVKPVSDTPNGFMQVVLDESSSHIGGFYPHLKTLVLQDFSRVKELRASPKLYLNTALEDLRRLSLANIFPFSATQMDNWSLSQLSGEIQGDFFVDDNAFSCMFEGSSVEYNKKLIEKCSFKALGTRSNWNIEKLDIGSFSLNAQMKREPGKIIIEEVQAKDTGISLLAAGAFSTDTKAFSLDVNHLEISLEHLKVTKNWKVLANLWKPEGKILFKGNINVDFSKGIVVAPFSVIGKAAIEGIKIRDSFIQNQADIPVSFSSVDGLKVEGLEINIRQLDQFQYKASFNLNKMHYNFEEETLRLHGLGFSLSGTYLRELGLLGRDFFPDLFDDQVLVFLRDIKREGGLQGYLNIDISQSQVLVGLQLKDGVYTFFGKEYDLKNVIVRLAPSVISIQADYQMEDVPLRILLQTERSDTSKGVAIISEIKDPSPNPMKVFWRWDSTLGLIIQRVEGVLAGLLVNLQEKQDSPQVLALFGQIKLQNVGKLGSMLSKELRSSISDWRIGNGYAFTGQFVFPRENWHGFSMQGVLDGKDFQFYGLEFDLLKANFLYSNKELRISQLSILDQGGKCTIPLISLKQDNQENWHLLMPSLRIQEFKPHAFSKDKQKTKPIKNLVIHEAELKDLSGVLGNLQSFRGSGYFRFEKIVKNTLSNVLLAIPSEILGSIGLNTSNMVPATGTVQFVIKDKRIYITNLLDVYSEGKKSRFYLPQGPVQSYVDFDGNMNIYIRIKQYNLLLKLTESLRFHITGKWDSPKFSAEKSSTPIHK
ncbi:MAG: hypothetical protein P4L16_07005 [Chlamydiales bacterium]|nr:hypothetical protein [Chlamydiales bacterium]